MRTAALAITSLFSLAFASHGFAQGAPAAAPPAAKAAEPAPWPKDAAALDSLGAKLVEDFFRRIVAKDWAAIDAASLPTLQRIGFEGAFDRASNLESLKELGMTAANVTELHATRAGDALVVTCQVQADSTRDGQKLPKSAASRLGVWQWSDGAWRMAAWAALNMPAVRPVPGKPRFAGDEALNKEGAEMVSCFLGAQHRKELEAFDGMLTEGVQVVNFKGQKLRADMIKGAKYATCEAPSIVDARATRTGAITVVTCNLSMAQKVGMESLPADPAPFMAVFQGTGASAKVIALANTNRPK